MAQAGAVGRLLSGNVSYAFLSVARSGSESPSLLTLPMQCPFQKAPPLHSARQQAVTGAGHPSLDKPRRRTAPASDKEARGSPVDCNCLVVVRLYIPNLVDAERQTALAKVAWKWITRAHHISQQLPSRESGGTRRERSAAQSKDSGYTSAL